MDIETLSTSRWILLPGTLCNASVFDRFLDLFHVAHHNRIELPLSKPAINDYLHFFEHDVEPGDIICGFSLGAIVAAHYAHKLDQASALFLFALNPHKDDPAKAPGRIALQNDVHQNGGRLALQQISPTLNGSTPDKALSQILAMAEQTTKHIDAYTGLALSRPGALDSLQKCRIPVYALTGEQDEQASPACASIVAGAAPMGKYCLLAGLGHYALLEDPAACAAAVRTLIV